LDASVTTGAKGVEKANKYSFPVGSKDNKVPVHMRPKNSMSVKSHNKSKSSSDYHPVLLISTLTQVHDGPIWCSEFSPDGKYFATGGEDGVVQIWKVAPNSSESHSPAEPESKWRGMNDMRRSNHNRNSNDEKDPPAPPLSTANSSVPPRGTEIDLLSYEPIQRFTSHRRDVVDLSWSHSGYLLSASLDKTARLWHPTRDVCLSTFNHPDAITCVNFHPNHDRYFLTGGFDQKVRIWSIPNGRVEGFSQAPANISAATFDPKGDHIFAGLFTGKVMIYSVDDEMKMKYFTQTSCRNRNNKKTDNKVTGLMFLRGLSEDKVDDGTLNTGESDDAVTSKRWSKTKAMMGGLVGRNKKKKEAVKRKMLVTTNDSRLRLLGTDDFCVVRKYAYKGNHNSFLQIKARFSESGKYSK
jgi:WD40 repeat protein